ncbi:MAG: hypothetical protein ACOYNI_01245 [Acidimicrobiia bacterium]
METMLTWVRTRVELAVADRRERGFVVAENLGYLVVAIAVIGAIGVALKTGVGEKIGDTVMGWISDAPKEINNTSGTTVTP